MMAKSPKSDCGIGISNGTSSNGRLENRGKIQITYASQNAIAASMGTFINEYCGVINASNS